MIFKMKNVSTHEIPITVRVDDYFGHHKYPGIIYHKWATLDAASWLDTWCDNFMEVIIAFASSDDFVREYVAQNLVIVDFHI